MNIIFKKHAPLLEEKYTILDLDTFRLPDGSQHTACCIVENIPIVELAETENLKKMHAELITNYGIRRWSYCEQAIEQLMGKWGGEMDTFYQDLASRIEKFKIQNLNDSWSPVIPKS
jgi:hypothetical protein